MLIDELISEDRKQELEKELEEEIFNLENKIICNEKFLYIIRKYNFFEYCYLRGKYIGDILKIYRFPVIELTDEFIVTEDTTEVATYNYKKNMSKYHINTIKKINSIESMKNKKRYIEKIRKRQK